MKVDLIGKADVVKKTQIKSIKIIKFLYVYLFLHDVYRVFTVVRHYAL